MVHTGYAASKFIRKFWDEVIIDSVLKQPQYYDGSGVL